MALKFSYPEQTVGEYVLSADKKKVDLNYLYNLLCIPSRYSTGLPPERFPLIVENSMCFSVFYHGKQIGFARVISDYTEFSSLWDVFIDEEHRNKGLGKELLNYIFSHPKLRGVFRWFLMTEDAHSLYEQFGFRRALHDRYIMMKVNEG